MKTTAPVEMRLASDVALELIDKTNVQTAYDKSGNLSHLVAKVPEREFYRLYSSNTTASVFIHGHWLQFLETDLGSFPGLAYRPQHALKQRHVVDRRSGARLRLDLATDERGATHLTISRKDRILLRKRFVSLTLEELETTSDGLQALAKAAIKVFAKIQGWTVLHAEKLNDMPCVHVVPETPEREEFYSGYVNLQ